MRIASVIGLVLVIIGALNWLLVGLFGFDLVAALFANGFGTLSALSRVVYLLVGISGIWLLFTVLPSLTTMPSMREATARSM